MQRCSPRALVIAAAFLLVACGAAPPPASGDTTNRRAPVAARDAAGRPPIEIDEEEEAGAEAVTRVRVEIPPGAPRLGPDDAPVTLVVFSDLECPFCARLAPTLDTLVETYGARLRVVWRDLPLPFHDRAEQAAEAAREALAQQGATGFWRMQELIFANQDALERADLARYATQLGLDGARFAAALDGRVHLAAVRRDAEDASRIHVGGTPTVFLNGRLVRGAQPLEVYVTIVNDELRRGEALVARGVAPAELYALRMRGARASAEDLEGAPARGDGEAARRERARPDPAAVYRVPIDGAPVQGAADALVTIVVFSDFECPFCSRVLPTLEQIRARYGREVRIVFRHNPLPFHRDAMPAAEAALEARAQRGDAGFWQMHDVLFANQRDLERAQLERYAAQLGLDLARFSRALDGGAHRAAIEADQALARSLGASGTPSFFVNGRSLRGAQPLAAFEALIDEELARAQARVAAGTRRARVYAEIIAAGATAPVTLDPAPEASPTPQAPRGTTPPVPVDVAAPPPGAQRTASGLASRVLAPGSGGVHPGRRSRVEVHYSGWTTDGAMFDSSVARGAPATFRLDQLIPGFAEGLELMVEGETRRLWIPEDLAYRGARDPRGMLVFDVELCRIVTQAE